MPVAEITKLEHVTVQVKVTREFRFRMWLGLKLMSLAVRVMGCGLKVESED